MKSECKETEACKGEGKSEGWGREKEKNLVNSQRQSSRLSTSPAFGEL